VRPEILVLNAGATPHMGRLDQLTWADFTATWDTDVKAGLYWLQAALNLPLKPVTRYPKLCIIEYRVWRTGDCLPSSGGPTAAWAAGQRELRVLPRPITKHRMNTSRTVPPPGMLRLSSTRKRRSFADELARRGSTFPYSPDGR
jgi:hypothetical protein